MNLASHGIIVYRASRLEALLAPLDGLLQAAPPAGMLAPQVVVAAHPGMRHWLLGELARHRGRRGVVANLEVVLPSSWLDGLAKAVLGADAVAVAPYRRAHLRWRIHELLGELPEAALQAYLRGDDASRRRFQLADRLAHVFSQYLVYRPDWLANWRRDGGAEPVEPILGPLWHRLRHDIGQPHRGERMRALLDALAADPGSHDDQPLHLFGLSHLAPAELAVVRAVARRRLVVFYLPDPCREYWGGLIDPRLALRAQAGLDAFGGDSESWFFEQERQHPLLARWGRLGQHFVMALHDDDGPGIDERHWQDRPEADIAPANRLDRVQESIRRLAPELMDTDLRADGALAGERADASLRVHACHTRLRELEVLRDQLLRALDDDRTLKPSDIVVMAPDIRAYVPLLPAVFGEPGERAGPLPYHLADVPLASAHPVFSAFQRLLSLPMSRLSAPELVDLASEPAIARRHRFAAEDLPLVARWLSEARVAWALDAGHRRRVGVPAIDEHTLAWGLDRLIGGYVFGEIGDAEAQAVALADGEQLAPLPGIGGPGAELLGRLDRLLRELAAFIDTAAATHRAGDWATRLAAHVEALLDVDRGDAGAVDARVQLTRIIAELASEPADAGLDPVLDYSVVRDVLSDKLAAVPERQRFLMGGVTVCGMVPQRAIPFKVVAVLGLNDGEFPRAAADAGLDPMSRQRRIGDRDARTDDRYLFLETLMSARQRLHLSYIGEGVRDGKRKNPAPPLAELLAALDAAAGIAPDDGKAERPWRIRHPLQPFDRRYFLAEGERDNDNDARLFSYSRRDLAMARREGRPPPPFYDGAGAASGSGPDEDAIIPLRELLAYYRDPARQVLSERLRLRLDALEDDRLADSEPLEARFEAIDRVGRRLFLEAAQHGHLSLPDQAPAWLRLTGLLPPGRPGGQAWQEEQKKVGALIAAARQHPLFAGDTLPPRSAIKLMRRIGRWQVGGELTRIHRADDADWLVDVFPRKKEKEKLTEDALGFKERIPAFIEWALLRLSLPRERPVRLCLLTESQDAPWQQSINDWDRSMASAGDAEAGRMRADLEARLDGLIAFWDGAQSQPRWYFPKTSWCAVEVSTARRAAGSTGEPIAPDNRVSFAFTGNERSAGERDYAPGYARVLAGEIDFAEGTDARRELDEAALHLRALIDLEIPQVPA